jgi:hypothetical protein
MQFCLIKNCHELKKLLGVLPVNTQLRWHNSVMFSLVNQPKAKYYY